MTPNVSLPMYNLPEMRADNARFWEALRELLVEAGLRDLPERLTFDRLPVPERIGPEVFFSQTCGYPLETNPVLANKMLTIGVIGGRGDLATAEYYKVINKAVNDRLGGKHIAEVIINSMDFAKSIHYVYGDLWDGGAVYIHAKAASLERADVALVGSGS